MVSALIYAGGNTPASRYALDHLKAAGKPIIDHPSPEVTHLLLDVPSFTPEGSLRGGGDVEALLSMLPQNVIVLGGNLQHPALTGYRCFDLLRDPAYVAENAAITAHCALRIAAEKLPIVFRDCPVLVIGWGRIGKCLGQMLGALEAKVTIGARKAADRAMAAALGYEAVDTKGLEAELYRFRLILNTVPEKIVSEDALSRCASCVKIDLASKQGLSSEDIIWAKGLPGIYAPESSGRLIARTVLQFLKEEEA